MAQKVLPGNGGWKEGLIYLGQALNTPLERSTEGVMRSFCVVLTPNEWGNCRYKILEIFRRTLLVTVHVALSPITLPLALAGRVVMIVGDRVRGGAPLYIKGDPSAERERLGELSLFFQNVCCLFGGLPFLFGGMQPARERIKEIAEKIKSCDPDLFAAAEVSVEAGCALAEELKGEYPHILTRIGPNGFKMESGFFFASKVSILSWEFVPFRANASGMRRGFLLVETSKAWIVVSHLIAGPAEEERVVMRRAQLAEIGSRIDEIGGDKEVILAMDANIADEEEYQSSELPARYFDPRNGGVRPSVVNGDTATCSTALERITQGKPEEGEGLEIDDYLVVAKRSCWQAITSQRWRRIAGFKPGNPFGSLSDHHGLFAEYQFEEQ